MNQPPGEVRRQQYNGKEGASQMAQRKVAPSSHYQSEMVARIEELKSRPIRQPTEPQLLQSAQSPPLVNAQNLQYLESQHVAAPPRKSPAGATHKSKPQIADFFTPAKSPSPGFPHSTVNNRYKLNELTNEDLYHKTSFINHQISQCNQFLKIEKMNVTFHSAQKSEALYLPNRQKNLDKLEESKEISAQLKASDSSVRKHSPEYRIAKKTAHYSREHLRRNFQPGYMSQHQRTRERPANKCLQSSQLAAQGGSQRVMTMR